MEEQRFSLQEDNVSEPSAKGSPLISWDIIMEGYHGIMRLIEDANRLSELALQASWKHQWNFTDKIVKEGNVVIVTKPDITIQFASENMYKMNGYFPAEVIGKTPRMFQGELTEIHTRRLIREAILERKPFAAELNNYRKDGEVYRCSIEGHPLFNKSGTLVNFIAFEMAS